MSAPSCKLNPSQKSSFYAKRCNLVNIVPKSATKTFWNFLLLLSRQHKLTSKLYATKTFWNFLLLCSYQHKPTLVYKSSLYTINFVICLLNPLKFVAKVILLEILEVVFKWHILVVVNIFQCFDINEHAQNHLNETH